MLQTGANGSLQIAHPEHILVCQRFLLEKTKNGLQATLGYNMIHFTPIQTPGVGPYVPDCFDLGQIVKHVG